MGRAHSPLNTGAKGTARYSHPVLARTSGWGVHAGV